MSKETQSGGIGLCGFIFLIFLVLKLLGVSEVATWSWWAVTAPLWIPAILVIGFLIIVYMLTGRR